MGTTRAAKLGFWYLLCLLCLLGLLTLLSLLSWLRLYWWGLLL